MKNRIQLLLENMKAEKKDAFFISDESNITYLTGFTGEAAYAIISLSGCVLMTDGRYDEQARNECKLNPENIEVAKWFNPKRPDPETISFYLKKFDIEKLMYNDSSLSVRKFNTIKKTIENSGLNIELWPITGEVEKLRAVKDELEIEYIRKACQIADKALEQLTGKIKVGVSELELVANLEYNMKMLGAENISFDTIILSGDKTSSPHGKPSDKRLEKGDFLQIDFGALYKGYHSDMSRTFIIGEASERQIELYNMMLEATVKSTEILKPGITAKVPDDVVRTIITDEYIESYYPGLGHGVGLDVHEGPSLSQSTKDLIEENNVVTIEPGVYVPGWGGMRIEDTILVTKDGYEVLSKFPRELMVLS